MSQNSEVSMSRIDARIPLAVRDTIDRAAALQGRTRTDFLIEAALEKAERVIAEPSLFLKPLTREYGERVTQA